MKLTRRKLAAAVLGSATVAQTQITPVNPADELKAARDRLRASLDIVAAQQVPMSLEPAFQFKA
jgi:hypothetical protein